MLRSARTRPRPSAPPSGQKPVTRSKVRSFPPPSRKAIALQPITKVARRLVPQIDVEVARLAEERALLVGRRLADLILEGQRLRWEESEHGVHDVDAPLVCARQIHVAGDSRTRKAFDLEAHDDHAGGLRNVRQLDRGTQRSRILEELGLEGRGAVEVAEADLIFDGERRADVAREPAAGLQRGLEQYA